MGGRKRRPTMGPSMMANVITIFARHLVDETLFRLFPLFDCDDISWDPHISFCRFYSKLPHGEILQAKMVILSCISCASYYMIFNDFVHYCSEWFSTYEKFLKWLKILVPLFLLPKIENPDLIVIFRSFLTLLILLFSE